VWGIATGNGVAVAVTNAFAAYTGQLWSSKDAVTWSLSLPANGKPDDASYFQIGDLTFGGSRFVAVGQGYDGFGRAWSGDGTGSWASATFAEQGSANAVAFAPTGDVVAVGSVNNKPAAWVSKDAASWTPVPLSGTTGEDARIVIGTPDWLVALGAADAGTIVWRSSDGASWVRQEETLTGDIDDYVGHLGSDLVATDGKRIVLFLAHGDSAEAWMGAFSEP
jgi:WD40 repeat protein